MTNDFNLTIKLALKLYTIKVKVKCSKQKA